MARAVEAGAGHGGHADFRGQVEGERDIVVPAKRLDLGHDVVGAAGAHAAETDVRQRLQQVVAPLAVELAQFLIVAVREGECLGAGFLQRGRCPDGEEVVHFADGRSQLC